MTAPTVRPPRRPLPWRPILSTVIELLGLALVVWGVSLFSIPAAVIAGGLGVVLVGIAIDPPAGRAKQ